MVLAHRAAAPVSVSRLPRGSSRLIAVKSAYATSPMVQRSPCGCPWNVCSGARGADAGRHSRSLRSPSASTSEPSGDETSNRKENQVTDRAALANLLTEVAETHHRVYRITDGVD